MISKNDSIKELNEILKEFNAINLDDINKIRLLNRIEHKFILKRSELVPLLRDLKDEFCVLKIDEEFLLGYDNVYFDTDDFLMYHTHQNGKMNRFKVRIRTYEKTGDSYLELKMKNNKKRVIKIREKLKEKEDIESEKISTLICDNLNIKASDLKKKVSLNYFRLLLANKNLTERLTIDVDLVFRSEEKESQGFADLVIIELKQDGLNKDAKIFNVLEKHNIKPFRVSKYCLGVYCLYDEVKKNKMKLKVTQLKKKLGN